MSKKKPNFEQLEAATNRRDAKLLAKLIADGGDPNATKIVDGEDYKVLNQAAGTLFSKGVETLLIAGANPNSVDSPGPGGGKLTALQWPLHGKLPDSGHGLAEIRQCKDFSDQRQAYERVCRGEILTIVDLLLNAGADPNLTHNLHLPLGDASARGFYDVAKRLIEGGAVVKTVPSGRIPPLVESATHIPQDCSTDEVNSARRVDFERTIKLLLGHGAPVDAEDPNGMNSLMEAARSGALKLVNLLLNTGADVNYEAKDGRTPLMFAAFFASGATAEEQHMLALRIIKRLMEAGADPNKRVFRTENLPWRVVAGDRALDIATRNYAMDTVMRIFPSAVAPGVASLATKSTPASEFLKSVTS